MEVRAAGKSGAEECSGFARCKAKNRTPSEKEANEDQGKECQGLRRLSSAVVESNIVDGEPWWAN